MAKRAVPTRVEPKWATQPEKLRERAVVLVEAVGEACFELGHVLYEIQASDAYKGWGYESFREYVDSELAFGKEKAKHYIGIWSKFEDELGYQWDEVRTIGWTKLARIASIVRNKRDAKKWLKLAGKNPRPALETLVKEERQRRVDAGEAEPERRGRPIKRVHHDTEEELQGAHETVDIPFVDPSVLHVEEIEFEDEDTGEVQPLHEFRMYLFPGQWVNVMAAMERSGQVGNTGKACVQLDLICHEFNETYATTEDGGVAQRLETHIKNLERIFEIEVEVTVPKNSALRKMSRLDEKPQGKKPKGKKPKKSKEPTEEEIKEHAKKQEAAKQEPARQHRW